MSEPDMEEHQDMMIKWIAETLESMPEKVMPTDMTAIIVNMIDTYDMDDVWPIIALEVTVVLKEIMEERLKNRVLN